MFVCVFLDALGRLGCRWQKEADYQAHGGEIQPPTQLSALSPTASVGLDLSAGPTHLSHSPPLTSSPLPL